MKLRNKKTGEIVDTLCRDDITKGLAFGIDHHDGNPTMAYYNSLDELNAEWEDYEEPKSLWAIGQFGELYEVSGLALNQIKNLETIGNYFETEEEAEKAVEKLKAWKRLKDNGFKFEGHNLQQLWVKIWLDHGYTEMKHDLDLLFGGEE